MDDVHFSGGPSAMLTFDDGTGPAIYLAGYSFPGFGNGSGVGRWDGTTWTPVGGAFDQGITTLAVFDDGTGNALYAAGVFSNVGSTPCNRVAKWNGSSWVPLGSGVDTPIYAMCAQQSGPTPGLYVGGSFSFAGGSPVNRIARWDGANWSAVGGGMDANVMQLCTYNTTAGPRVIATGPFLQVGGVSMSRIAQWDGTSWSPMVTGNGPDNVTALYTYDFGSGPKLYMSGGFPAFGGFLHNHLACWDGTNWSDVAGGFDGQALTIAPFDDGSGEALYFGGRFNSAGSVPALNIARFDGTSWSPLGGGIGDVSSNSYAQAMRGYVDASGPKLMVGGSFTQAGLKPAPHLAVWGVPCEAPWFLHQPQNTTAVFNIPIQFDVAPGGLFPMTYQWRHNGTPLTNGQEHIAGATSAHLTISQWSFSDAGSYDVVLTNAIGTTTSDVATLTVPAGGTTGVPINLTEILRPPVSAVGLQPGESATVLLVATQCRTGEFIVLATITGGNQGLFVWQGGTLTLIAREHSQADGLPAGILYSNFQDIIPADNGTFGFKANLEGQGVTPIDRRGYFFHDSQGTAFIVRGGDAPPGDATGNVFSQFPTAPTVGVGGQLAFSSIVRLNDVYQYSGVWYWDRANGLVKVARQGEPSPVSGHLYGNQTDPGTIDPQGHIVFGAALDNNHGVLLSGLPGALQVLLAPGDPLPGLPAGTLAYGGGDSIVCNAAGDFAFGTTIDTPGYPPAVYAWNNGTLVPILSRGDPVPGVPSGFTFFGAQPVAMNANGSVLLRAAIQGNCPGTCPSSGVWLSSSAGLQMICLNRTLPYPEIPDGWVLHDFTSLGLNDSDQVMVGAYFDYGSQYTASFGWTAVSGLFPVCVPGTQVEITPGAYATVMNAGPLNLDAGVTGPLQSSAMSYPGSGAFQIVFTTWGRSLYRAQFNSLLGLYFPCPMVQTQPPVTTLAAYGQDMILATSASGGGFLDYRWSHDSIDIFDDGRVTGTGTDTLTIHAATLSDYGSYSLRVSNICGFDQSHTAWVEVGAGVAYCFGDGTGTRCPCSNASAPVPPSGCLNSLGNGGSLRSAGNASLSNDTLVLSANHMPNGAALYFQGTTQVNGGAGVVFGDGLRCAGGSIVRLGTETNFSGGSTYPSGDPAISVKGNITLPGSVRTYQVWYRNAASFCTQALYNLTNGYVVTWMP